MGLDWIVNIYEKDTFKQVEKKYEELGYTGINDVRGKAIAYLLDEYEEYDTANMCYGLKPWNEDGEDLPHLMHPRLQGSIILATLKNLELRDLNSDSIVSTVEEQKEWIEEFEQMLKDINNYNEKTSEYQALIWCWY